MYELVGHYTLRENAPHVKPADILEFIVSRSPVSPRTGSGPALEDIYVTKAKIVYGSSGDKPGDPVNQVRFFNPKHDVNTAFPLHAKRFSPLFSPTEFVEVTMLVFCRVPRHSEVVAEAFRIWKEVNLRHHSEQIPCINSSPSSIVKRQQRKRGREDDPPNFDAFGENSNSFSTLPK